MESLRRLIGRVDDVPCTTVLVAAACCQVGISVAVKFLTRTELSVLNQIFLRNLLASSIGLILVPAAVIRLRKLNLAGAARLSFRSLVYFGAIYFWTLAFTYASLANVALISGFPFVAVVGWLIFRDIVDVAQLALLLLALLGVILITIGDITDFQIRKGELYAIAASALFALMYLLSRIAPNGVTNNEFSVMTQAVTGVLVFSLTIGSGGIGEFTSALTAEAVFFAAVASLFIISNTLAVGSALPRTTSVVANTVLYLYPILGVLASIIFFADLPTNLELLGGAFILVACGVLTHRQSKLNSVAVAK